MISVGKKLRLARILRENGRTIIVPIDHGIENYYGELEDPRKLVKEFLEGEIDAILLRRGTLFKVCDLIAGKVGVIYRISGATGTSDVFDQRIISSVDAALKHGADAIIYSVVIGHPKENDMFQMFGELSDKAREFEIPIIGEVDVWAEAKGDRFELIRQGVRALSEEGADIVKSYFPNEFDSFKKIIRYSLSPVVAAGGPKLSNPIKVLEFVKQVIDAGAVGTSIGRNIWQYEKPSKMIKGNITYS
jgi:DhnA-type fructose-1,6-bisphosphate aldolase and related enzymes